jgi:TonB family protein
MRFTIRIGLLFLITGLLHVYCMADDQPNDALSRAQKLSSLTEPHAKPFHLKLTISEPANPNSPYRATIEEFWQSPKLWQRTIDSPNFRQHLIVKGSNRTEQDSGDYYPLWLRNFVTASTDPLEDAAFWNQVSARIVISTSTNGVHSSSCARAQFKIGTPALNNDAFAVICFNADGTLQSVVRPGYDMEFQDQRSFGKKRIAYQYADSPEPGTDLVGKIDELEQLPATTDLPALPDLANQSSNSMKNVHINQETFEKMSLGQTVLAWPSVHSGKTSGKLSMYVSTDRDGRIREAYPLNSDNAGLQDSARDQLLKWRLKPAVSDGSPVQTEAALTFAFSTTLDATAAKLTASTPSSKGSLPDMKPIVISPAIASSLRTKLYAPIYPQALKEHHISGKVNLDAIIGREGEIISLTPLKSTDPEFTKAAIAAVEHWRYKPYLLNGNPVEIETEITINFRAP